VTQPEPKRATCDCGRAFVDNAGVAECSECREYRTAVRAGESFRPSASWSPPRPGCDLPTGEPWHEDDDEGGGVA